MRLLIPNIQYDWDGAEYMNVLIQDRDGRDTGIYLVLCVSPSLRVVSYNCVPDL